ncbi:hypothetical protein GCT19_14680 [Paraburkholderia sp. CNPSo 3155]|nr:hypothetical protein [Paraburkholderia atlantica]
MQDRHLYRVNPRRFFLGVGAGAIACRSLGSAPGPRRPVLSACRHRPSTTGDRGGWAARSSIAIGTGPLIQMRVAQSPVFERIKATWQVVKAAVIELLRAVESL